MSHYDEQREEERELERIWDKTKLKEPNLPRSALRMLRNRTERLERDLEEARKEFWREFKRVHKEF